MVSAQNGLLTRASEDRVHVHSNCAMQRLKCRTATDRHRFPPRCSVRVVVASFTSVALIVVSARDDLLASGSEEDGVLELRGVAALDVAERRVGVHDSLVAEILQRHGVAGGARALQPALAEGESAEVLVDRVQQLLRRLQPV